MTVRWNIAVSPNTDQSVRMFFASQGGGRKGDLSKFIEEAVRARILDLAVTAAKTATSKVSEAYFSAIVAESVSWAQVGNKKIEMR